MHFHDSISVWLRGGVPAAFTWRGRAYHIRVITDRWNRRAHTRATLSTTARCCAVEPDFWRVNAACGDGPTGTYELRYTPRAKTWHLTAADSTVSAPGRRTPDHADQ